MSAGYHVLTITLCQSLPFIWPEIFIFTPLKHVDLAPENPPSKIDCQNYYTLCTLN